MGEGWNPILAAVEREPGHWEMLSQYDKKYGDVRLVRRGVEVGYRAVVLAVGAERPVVVGYFRSLRASCEAVHLAWVRTHGGTAGRSETRYGNWGRVHSVPPGE